MYQIIIHTLGWADIADREPYQYVNPADWTTETLAFNLNNLWAWNDIIDSDGPCVAIIWSN